MGVIFVCGVHGAGKTTFCSKLSDELGIPFFSASSLIKEESQNAISKNPTDKKVKDVKGNQEILIRAVAQKIKDHEKIILDGHTTVINQNGEITLLPIEVFGCLNIEKIIIVDTPAELIKERIFQRDKRCLEDRMLQNHINLEIKNAHEISSHLGIPIEIERGQNL